MGTFVGADRAYVFQFSGNGTRMDNTHEWCAPGVRPQIGELQGLSAQDFGWLMARMACGEAFQITDVAAMPAEAQAERMILEAGGIRSLLSMPIGPVGCPLGFIGFDNVREVGEWRSEDRDMLRVAAQLIADALERQRAHQALELSLQRQKAILENIPDIAWLKDADGRLIHVNEPLARALGVSADALVGKTDMDIWPPELAARYRGDEAFRMVHEDSDEPVADPVARCMAEGRVVGLGSRRALLTRGGERRVIEHSAAPMCSARGQIDGAVLVFKDITARRRLDQQIAYAASHDSLTGLVNRAKFDERLDQALAAYHKRGTPAVLCYLDLDQFKVVNDAAGHSAGDEMLKQVAALLSASVRSRDTLARLGGDEFGLLLEDCSVGDGITICETLISTLSDFRFKWGDRRFGIGVSIGIVPVEGVERSALTSRADMACYAAKDLGRNRVCVYHPEDAELMRRHREIIRVAELREALENDRFVLYAQPVTPARTPYGQPWRHEVLVRLRAQDDGLLLPGAFIPAAERYGLIGKLDRWVIRTALREYAELGARADRPGIAINISGTSLSDESLPAFVRAELAASGVAPSRVCFEITETAAVSRLSLARRFIEELRGHGCSFALDDFGSGLSSFSYLKHLPVDWLKVDGSFVKGMADDPVDEAMVKAITQIGHVMGIRTVAERVDTEAVLKAAVASGVDFVQGFEIGRPVPLRQIGG